MKDNLFLKALINPDCVPYVIYIAGSLWTKDNIRMPRFWLQTYSCWFEGYWQVQCLPHGWGKNMVDLFLGHVLCFYCSPFIICFYQYHFLPSSFSLILTLVLSLWLFSVHHSFPSMGVVPYIYIYILFSANVADYLFICCCRSMKTTCSCSVISAGWQ